MRHVNRSVLVTLLSVSAAWVSSAAAAACQPPAVWPLLCGQQSQARRLTRLRGFVQYRCDMVGMCRHVLAIHPRSHIYIGTRFSLFTHRVTMHGSSRLCQLQLVHDHLACGVAVCCLDQVLVSIALEV